MMMTLLFSSTVLATTYGTIYSIEEMTDLSNDVISGTIKGLNPTSKDGVIQTQVSVQIEHNFVGNKQNVFTFDVPGGTLDGVTMSVSGAPKFEIGQGVLLFMEHNKVVGFGQGAYALTDKGFATREFTGVDIPETADLSSNRVNIDKELPDETEARSCMEVKVWDDYNDDWTLRTIEVDHVADGEFKSYPMTLLQDMKYEFISCTDEKSDGIALSLYTLEGEEIVSVYNEGREALLEFHNKKTQTVLLAVQVEILDPEVKQVGTSVGVLYK
jgi:hypothetical protein